MSKTIAIFPARGKNKKQNKSMVDFLGRPIISYAIEEAKRSGLFDVIHVSTDCEDVAATARQLDVDARFVRPEYLSEDTVPVSAVVKWVLHQFIVECEEHFDDVFVIFPCSPLLDANDLRQAYELYKSYNREYGLMTVAEAPSRVEKYFKKVGERLVPINNEHKNTLVHDLELAYYNIGTFTIHPVNLFLDDSIYDYIAYEVKFWKEVNVDIPEHLRFAELLYRSIHG